MTKKLVILAICLFVLFWLLATYLRIRQALYWWYQRQAAQLCVETEGIQEGLLQECFALRRSLELVLADDLTCTKEVQTWLTQLEAIQHSLETLTHRLSPPYLNDSLLLAIQHLLKQWQVMHSTLKLEIELPTDWEEESIEQRRVILAFLNELLHVIAAQPLPETLLCAQLSQQAQSRLMIHLTASNVPNLLSSANKELTYLQQSFQVLANGKCYCRRQGSTATWYCQWRSF